MSYDCYCDFEAPEFYEQSEPTAKKLHSCCECGRAIQPGQKYMRVTGKWDGSFDTFKRCERCVALVAWIKAHVPCFCDMFKGLYQDETDELVRAYPELHFGFHRRRLRAHQHPTVRQLLVNQEPK